jgi:hypothetical protein
MSGGRKDGSSTTSDMRGFIRIKANDAAEIGIGLEHLKSILFDFQVVLDFFDLRLIKMHSLEHGHGAIFDTHV